MAVLLTGATGFVGRNIAQALLARQQEVVLFAPPAPADRWPGHGQPGAHVAAGDIRSSADLDRAFALASIDRVIHAAALTPDALAEAAEPGLIVDVNLGGTARLMQAARRAGASRVLGVSSVAIYGYAAPGPDGRLHEETAIARPAALYGITKLASEQIVNRLGGLYDIETAVVRLGPCFGVNEYPTGVRPLLSPHWQCAEAARTGRECVLPRAMRADWVDAEAAAAAIVDLLAAADWQPGVFNVGGGTLTTVDAWCEALATLRPGFRWRIDPNAATVRYGLERDRAPMDMTRLQAAIGWTPSTDDLERRARHYLAWREGQAGAALCGDLG